MVPVEGGEGGEAGESIGWRADELINTWGPVKPLHLGHQTVAHHAGTVERRADLSDTSVLRR